VRLLALGDLVQVVVGQLDFIDDVPSRGRVVARDVREAADATRLSSAHLS
jgi:hypothetical protein